MNRALRAATMGALLLTPVALTACSAGQVNQTASQERDKIGPATSIGDLELRQVVIVDPGEVIEDRSFAYEAGDAPELMLTIANTGDSSDTLLAVRAEGFDGVLTEDPAAEPTTSAPTPGTDESPTGDTPTTGTPTTEAAPTPVDRLALTIPAKQNITIGLRQYQECPLPEGVNDRELRALCQAGRPQPSDDAGADSGTLPDVWYVPVIDDEQPRLFLAGLPSSLAPLTAGQTITVTFVFREAGEVTVDALVMGPYGPTGRGPAFDFHGEEHGAESGEEQDTEAE